MDPNQLRPKQLPTLKPACTLGLDGLLRHYPTAQIVKPKPQKPKQTKNLTTPTSTNPNLVTPCLVAPQP